MTLRILFIGSQKFDYLQDIVFSGLIKILGRSQVREYPFRRDYLLSHKKYPKNLGTDRSAKWQRLLSQAIGPKNADLVIVASTKPDCFAAYLSLMHVIPKSTPLVLIDGGDRPEIGGDLIRLNAEALWTKALNHRPFDMVFKREKLLDVDYGRRVYPLPFAINPHALRLTPTPVPHPDKEVCFWAVNSHPIRQRAFELLKGRFDCDGNGTGSTKDLRSYQFRGHRYFEQFSRARVAISLRGGGWDTLRYWEIPALGPVMVSTLIGIEIPNDFVDGEHVMRCRDDLSDMIVQCQFLLDHDAQRQKMSAAAQGHLLKYHTNVHRAQFVLDQVAAIT